MLDIYATSIDYDPALEMSVLFFKTLQNKMHWAAHGNTAAEIIYKRVDSGKPHLGLSNFKGKKPTKQETAIAKNHLTEKELDILNRIVTAYLELAEIQALNQEPMYMKDWIEQLDSFLKMTRKEILSHSGKISHEQALQKAHFVAPDLTRFPRYIFRQAGKPQPPFFASRAVGLPEVPDTFQDFSPDCILFFQNPDSIFSGLFFFGFGFHCHHLFGCFDVLFSVTAR